MSNDYRRSALDAHNLILGGIAATALLAAAWLGQALAHTTTPGDALWRNLASHKTATIPAAKPAPAPLAVAVPAPAPPPQIFQQLSPQDAMAQNAKIPFSDLPNPAAAPFRLDAADSSDRTRALDCLTMAVYYEAASEPDEGQAAVAQVVLNRLRHPLFPKTICGVVLQGSTLATGCQFTFTCDGSLNRRPTQAGWDRARRTAERALNGYVLKSVGEATHYHTVWVVPYWQPSVVKLTQIGAHIFYRWSGGMGRPIAFDGRYAGLEPPAPQIAGLTDSVTAAPVATPVKLETATAPADAPAPVIVARVAPKIQLADLTPPALAAAQALPQQPQGYFSSPTNSIQRQRLPVANGW